MAHSDDHMPPAGQPAGGASTTNNPFLDVYLSGADQISAGEGGTGGGGITDQGVPLDEEGNPYLVLINKGKTVKGQPLDATPQGYGSETTDISTPPKFKDIGTLVTEFQKASRREQRRMAFLLTLGGFVSTDARLTLDRVAEFADNLSLGQVVEAYARLVTDASDSLANGIPLTPDQLLTRAINYKLPTKVDWDGNLESLRNTLKEYNVEAEALEEGGGKKDENLARTEVRKDTLRNFMDPADAKALVRSLLQQELGRDPTAGEFDEFLAAVHQAEARNPTTTKYKTRYNKEGDLVSQNTTTHQGISVSGVRDQMLEKARSQPGWAEWQAVGTYGPALFEALGATVPGR